MGSSLIISNGDFSENAIYTFCKMLVKAGTQVSIPVRASAETILWTMEADASNMVEDTYFEIQVPDQYENTPWTAPVINNAGMFSPEQNPSANNILELYIDMTLCGYASYFCLNNSRLRKITLFTTDLITLALESGLQNLSNLEYVDLSKLELSSIGSGSPYPLLCPNLKEANLARVHSKIISVCDYMFSNCNAVEKVNLIGWRFNSNTTWSNAFNNCLKLNKIYIDDADSAAILINVLSNVASAHIDGEATQYDPIAKVINVVHIPY